MLVSLHTIELSFSRSLLGYVFFTSDFSSPFLFANLSDFLSTHPLLAIFCDRNSIKTHTRGVKHESPIRLHPYIANIKQISNNRRIINQFVGIGL